MQDPKPSGRSLDVKDLATTLGNPERELKNIVGTYEEYTYQGPYIPLMLLLYSRGSLSWGSHLNRTTFQSNSLWVNPKPQTQNLPPFNLELTPYKL